MARQLIAIETDFDPADPDATFAKVVAHAGWTVRARARCDSSWLQARINPDTGAAWTQAQIIQSGRWPFKRDDGPEGWLYGTTSLSDPGNTNAAVDDFQAATTDPFLIGEFYANKPPATHYDPAAGVVLRPGVRLVARHWPEDMVNAPGVWDPATANWATAPVYYSDLAQPSMHYDLEADEPAFSQDIKGLWKERLGQVNNILTWESRRRNNGIMVDAWGWQPGGPGTTPWATVKLMPGDVDGEVSEFDLQRGWW